MLFLMEGAMLDAGRGVLYSVLDGGVVFHIGLGVSCIGHGRGSNIEQGGVLFQTAAVSNLGPGGVQYQKGGLSSIGQGGGPGSGLCLLQNINTLCLQGWGGSELPSSSTRRSADDPRMLAKFFQPIDREMREVVTVDADVSVECESVQVALLAAWRLVLACERPGAAGPELHTFKNAAIEPQPTRTWTSTPTAPVTLTPVPLPPPSPRITPPTATPTPSLQVTPVPTPTTIPEADKKGGGAPPYVLLPELMDPPAIVGQEFVLRVTITRTDASAAHVNDLQAFVMAEVHLCPLWTCCSPV